MEQKRQNVKYMLMGIGTILLLVSFALENTEAERVLALIALPTLFGGMGYAYENENHSYGKQYFLPYLVFSILYLVMQSAFLMAGKADMTLEVLQDDIWSIVTGNGAGFLWMLCNLSITGGIYRFLRKRMKISGVTILAVLAAVSVYFLNGIGGRTTVFGRSFPGFFFSLAMTMWRSVALLPFLVIGEFARHCAARWERKLAKKIGIGFGAVLLSLALAIVALKNQDLFGDYTILVNIRLLSMGVPGFIYVVGGLFVFGCGLLMDWIGTLKILSLLGKNCVVPIATFYNFYVFYLATRCGKLVFAKFDNNFMTVTTMVLITLLLETTGIAIYMLPGKITKKK